MPDSRQSPVPAPVPTALLITVPAVRLSDERNPMSSIPESVADSFYGAIERNDFAMVASLYGDDLKTWRSFDLVSQNKADQLATLAAINSRWTSHYRVIERHVHGDRLIQRHELTLTERSGAVAHRLQAAAFLTIRDGQVHTLDEYLDSRDAGDVLEAMRSTPVR